MQDKQAQEGQVIDVLPNATFKVKLEGGQEVIAHLSGKMRINHIRVLLADNVAVEVSPDGRRGRIVRRR